MHSDETCQGKLDRNIDDSLFSASVSIVGLNCEHIPVIDISFFGTPPPKLIEKPT